MYSYKSRRTTAIYSANNRKTQKRFSWLQKDNFVTNVIDCKPYDFYTLYQHNSYVM